MGFIGRNRVCIIECYKSSIDRQILKIIVKPFPKNKVLVIMKNPSSTCRNLPNGNQMIKSYSQLARCYIDRTTGKVLRKLRTSYDEIDILNLYSLFSSKPVNVNSYYYHNNNGRLPTIFANNNLTISQYLSGYSGEVICAWGSNNGINKKGYDNQISNICKLFNTNHTLLEYDNNTQNFISLTNKYPLHGLKWK